MVNPSSGSTEWDINLTRILAITSSTCHGITTRVGNYIPTFFIDIKYNFFHFIDIIYRYKI